MCPPPPSGLACLARLACLSCNGPGSLAFGCPLLWVWVWVRSAGLRAGRATPNGRARRPMYPAKSALAQEGGGAKLIAGKIPKLRHSTATWSGSGYCVHTRTHALTLTLSLCHSLAQLNLASGQLAARTHAGVGLLFPADACLPALLASWLAAQGVRCSTTYCTVAHHLVDHRPISLLWQKLSSREVGEVAVMQNVPRQVSV